MLDGHVINTVKRRRRIDQDLECTPAGGHVRMWELDYLDRAFEEKAHGHAAQIFD